MTLIHIPQNNIHGLLRSKSKFWEQKINRTPNEAIKQDTRYQDFVRKFKHFHKLPVDNKWFEIRVIGAGQSPIITLSRSPLNRNWWEDSLFMDQVYWVFQKPVPIMIKNEPVFFYALEPMENLRCLNAYFHRYHREMADQRTALFVAVEACAMAWDETTNGISDHIHYRPEVVKTQAELDNEHKRKLEAEKLLSEAIPLEQVVSEKVSKKLGDGDGNS